MIITISRESASNGELIGHLVAERMGFRVFDRELVEEIARRLHADPKLVAHFDEASLTPVQSILWEWRTSMNESIYGRYLRQALERIHKERDAVVIGRGGNFILHCSQCLHVRLVAPLALRTAIYRTEHEVDERLARQRIQEEDEQRRRFVRTFFHEDINDAHHYDLVINLGGVTPESAAELIVKAAHERATHRLPVAAKSTLPQHIEIMARHRRPHAPEQVERG